MEVSVLSDLQHGEKNQMLMQEDESTHITHPYTHTNRQKQKVNDVHLAEILKKVCQKERKKAPKIKLNELLHSIVFNDTRADCS